MNPIPATVLRPARGLLVAHGFRRAFTAAFILLLLPAFSRPLLSQEQAAHSRFERTVAALNHAEIRDRVRFANIALLQLAEIYIAEADLARHQSEDAGRPEKLLAWSRAVDRYAGQLGLVLEDIELGFPVVLRNNPHEVSSVSVGERTVMLAHPRSDQQPAFEHNVLEAFCAGNACASLTAGEEGLTPIPVTTSRVTARWEFSADGPVCSYRGLSVHFDSRGQLGRQRELCQQMLDEAETLAAELAWQQRHGVTIDWQNLQIMQTPGKPDHLVVLNAAGDSLLITVPLLYSTPGLLFELNLWMQQRYAPGGSQPLILESGALGWE